MKLWFSMIFFRTGMLWALFSFLLFLLCAMVDLVILSPCRDLLDQGSNLQLSLFYTLEQGTLFLLAAFFFSVFFKTLRMNARLEWSALVTSGLSKKKLCLPFFALSVLVGCSITLYDEYIAPFAKKKIFFLEKKPWVYAPVFLEEKGILFYEEKKGNTLYEVYWLENSQELWRMNTLDKATKIGKYVDYFEKNGKNVWEKADSFAEKTLDKMPLFSTDGLGLRRFCIEISLGLLPGKTSLKAAARSLSVGLFPLLTSLIFCPYLIKIAKKEEKKRRFFLLTLLVLSIHLLTERLLKNFLVIFQRLS